MIVVVENFDPAGGTGGVGGIGGAGGADNSASSITGGGGGGGGAIIAIGGCGGGVGATDDLLSCAFTTTMEMQAAHTKIVFFMNLFFLVYDTK